MLSPRILSCLLWAYYVTTDTAAKSLPAGLAVCTAPKQAIATCDGINSGIVLDTSASLTMEQISNECNYVRDTLLPVFNWGSTQNMSVYGVSGASDAVFQDSNTIQPICEAIDEIAENVVKIGQSMTGLQSIIQGAIAQAKLKHDQTHLILISGEQNDQNIRDAGDAIVGDVVANSVKITVVALNGAPFTLGNFPCVDVYNVDMNNMDAYPGLPHCILDKMCAIDDTGCDISVDPFATTIPTTTLLPTTITLQPISAGTLPSGQTTSKPPGDDDNLECGCNYETIWNDVMLVFDTSMATTKDGLQLMLEVAQSQLDFLTIQASGQETTPLNTHLGIVTYSNTAKLMYGLGEIDQKAFQALPSLPFDNGPVSNIEAGVEAAIAQFHTDGNRPNARNVIILFTKSYNPRGTVNPETTCDLFKGNNGVMIIYDFVIKSDEEEPDLIPLASPGYYISSSMDKGDAIDKALCNANCFCPPNTVSYNTDPSIDLPHGGCYFTDAARINNGLAKHRCSNFDNATLAIDRSQKKTNFLNSVAPINDDYWIGLYYDAIAGGYLWADNTTLDTKYAPFFDKVDPPAPGSECVYVNQNRWYQASCRVSEFFICEMTQCDSLNYCDEEKMSLFREMKWIQ